MRPFVIISVLLVFAGPAAAQGWQEYSYPDYSFRVSFPAAPQIEATTFEVAEIWMFRGKSVNEEALEAASRL